MIVVVRTFLSLVSRSLLTSRMMIVCLLLVSYLLLMEVSSAAPVSSATFNLTAIKQSAELEEGLLTQLFNLEGELETLEEEVGDRNASMLRVELMEKTRGGFYGEVLRLRFCF